MSSRVVNTLNFSNRQADFVNVIVDSVLNDKSPLDIDAIHDIAPKEVLQDMIWGMTAGDKVDRNIGLYLIGFIYSEMKSMRWFAKLLIHRFFESNDGKVLFSKSHYDRFRDDILPQIDCYEKSVF